MAFEKSIGFPLYEYIYGYAQQNSYTLWCRISIFVCIDHVTKWIKSLSKNIGVFEYYFTFWLHSCSIPGTYSAPERQKYTLLLDGGLVKGYP